LVKLLRERLGVRDVEIVSGQTSREKRVRVRGISPEGAFNLAPGT
jgi:uncharacterized protein YggU (UPF0235/DUF167 family)